MTSGATFSKRLPCDTDATEVTSHLLRFAKSMRRQPTDAEAAMWKMLRGGRILGHKFKRQQPIGDYIVDFVCFERRLVIEIDGGQHSESADRERSRWLRAKGFAILRFWNNDVLSQPEGIFDSISRALRDNPSPQPLSRKGRGALGTQSFGPSSHG